ncbi:MAG: hypothetical protein ACK2UY_02890 [Anaerolineae bacterium]|jgi:hypothetical protein
MAAGLAIATLVEAVTAIATIVSQTGEIVDRIQPRKKVPEEQVDALKESVESLKESKQRLGQVAATLGAYVQSYVAVSPIATKCERLLVYLRENQSRLDDPDAADAWSVINYLFRDIDHDASREYHIATFQRSGSLDQEDLGYIRASIEKFASAANQAKPYIERNWTEGLIGQVQDMDEASRAIPNVLQRRIDWVLERLARLA